MKRRLLKDSKLPKWYRTVLYIICTQDDGYWITKWQEQCHLASLIRNKRQHVPQCVEHVEHARTAHLRMELAFLNNVINISTRYAKFQNRQCVQAKMVAFHISFHICGVKRRLTWSRLHDVPHEVLLWSQEDIWTPTRCVRICRCPLRHSVETPLFVFQ